MFIKNILFFIFIICIINPINSQTNTGKDNSINLELISDKLVGPVAFASYKDKVPRIFVVEQRGIIKVVLKEGKTTTFLDLRKRLAGMNKFYSEKGLLGLAFHPKFPKNRLFYVNYSAKSTKPGTDHKTVVSSFVVSLGNKNRAMSNSEKVILTIDQPESNHNGGSIEFGPDGYLYIGSGDGGGAGDAHGVLGNAQNLSNLLGKLLRIDIDNKTKYSIPKDNPEWEAFGKNEIYAYGLRNPWKFSFDSKTGKLFLADVGQNLYEEINIIKKGKNYGWKVMEGTHCFEPQEGCDSTGKELPINEYDHTVGNSVIGGYVYRKDKKSPYYGKYIFGDWSGKIFSLTNNKGKWERKLLNIDKAGKTWTHINSFGQDAEGNIYILVQDEVGPTKRGYLYKLKL